MDNIKIRSLKKERELPKPFKVELPLFLCRLINFTQRMSMLLDIFPCVTPEVATLPVSCVETESVVFVIAQYHAGRTVSDHPMNQSECSQVIAPPIYQITSENCRLLWVGKGAILFPVTEFTQQTDQGAGMAMNITDDIISLVQLIIFYKASLL